MIMKISMYNKKKIFRKVKKFDVKRFFGKVWKYWPVICFPYPHDKDLEQDFSTGSVRTKCVGLGA